METSTLTLIMLGSFVIGLILGAAVDTIFTKKKDEPQYKPEDPDIIINL